MPADDTITFTVLLIEDSRDDRELYAMYRRAAGFQVIEADNTFDGLRFALTSQVHIIVSDLRMPGPFDGVQLIRLIRNDARTRSTPVVVVTACAVDAERERAEAAGCTRFLSKPCLPEMLVREVRHLLHVALM